MLPDYRWAINMLVHPQSFTLVAACDGTIHCVPGRRNPENVCGYGHPLKLWFKLEIALYQQELYQHGIPDFGKPDMRMPT